MVRALAVALVPAVFTVVCGGADRSLLDAVAWAYGIPVERILAPEWFRQARYPIESDKAALRQALEERFAIIADFQVRPVATWVLECPDPAGVKLEAETESRTVQFGPGFLRGVAEPEVLARVLGRILQAEVVDESGVGGLVRYSLSWQADDTDSLMRALGGSGFELSKEYRDARVLVVYSAFWPDEPKPPRHTCDPKRDSAPEYLFAEMAAQDAIRAHPETWEPVLASYGHMPDRTAAGFLEARLRSRLEPARAMDLLKVVLRAEPDFGRAYLLGAELARPGAGREGYLRRFAELCPASLADAGLYEDVPDLTLIRARAEAFARTLIGRTDTEAFTAYPHYWRMRQKAGPWWPSNWLELDLLWLRHLDRRDDPAWTSAREAGYALLKTRSRQ